MEPKLDCRFYIGEKPCIYKKLCDNCQHYSPMGVRVLILKLGAIGDALRTTPILHALSREYHNPYIIWVTDEESYPILQANHLIDKLMINKPEFTFPLLSQEFDLVLCLDKDPSVTALATQVNARIRRGYAMSPYGTLDIFNDASQYSLDLGLDDDLKFFKNTKTYQEIIYEMAELTYERDPYIFNLSEKSSSEANKIINDMSFRGKGPLIGLNTGCGDVFATKKWPDDHFIRLAQLCYEMLDARVVLLGGKSEQQSNQLMETRLEGIAANAGYNKLQTFAGLLQCMDLIVASDTMALHLSLAMKTLSIGLFGPTCHQEIDFYDHGEPVIMRCACSPCYRKTCRNTNSCMSKLEPEMVMKVVRKLITCD